jgi:hypothetical protein
MKVYAATTNVTQQTNARWFSTQPSSIALQSEVDSVTEMG